MLPRSNKRKDLKHYNSNKDYYKKKEQMESSE